ncbi:phosphodiester glycosidase family protein [Streptacidiphilus sp. PB12-B1b]|uniref:phosphodiester glycosidase family protein n=1 Tax=Streptacidiphilus sp. PB12-B1b TaxID=2705012 RepID=UPI0015F8A8EF|nr:phosphodiester glycosidase family protein [Streptacidiphilus sp. PB12-B1b]QMU77692.1 phosphodiester glycosidase family protein [Streptacidiphilus sp. PB12-B1b]
MHTPPTPGSATEDSDVTTLEPPAPTPAPKRPGWIRRLLARRSTRAVLAVAALFAGWLSWSLGSALAAPGDDSVAARVAEWGRDHELGPVVTALESVQYKAHPPAVGGRPDMALVPTGEAAQGASGAKPALPAVVPPRLASPAGEPLAGEGTWKVLGSVRGTPALYGAYVRPDADHTSYVAGVVSMDQRILRFALHPGEVDPGAGNWGVPPYIPADQRAGLMATFNGGFKVDEARGGFYLNGVTRGTLTDDDASLVFYRDGHAEVGAWNRDVKMGPQVVGVRQNLNLIVDNGQVPDGVDSNVESGWGLTIAGDYFVWRSGAGITRDGRLVYAYGPALSVRTLADLLQRAGCVQAMQLDINPAWMSYMYYKPTSDPAKPTPVKLLPTQERPADRYFESTSRDFTAVYAR